MGLKRAAVRTERVSVLDGFEGRDCGTQKFGGKLRGEWNLLGGN